MVADLEGGFVTHPYELVSLGPNGVGVAHSLLTTELSWLSLYNFEIS